MNVERSGVSASIEFDPLYAQALSHMQEGRWREASEALTELERRYPDAAAVRKLRQALALRLSAECTWAAANRRSWTYLWRMPIIRILVIANATLYLLLGFTRLVAGIVLGM